VTFWYATPVSNVLTDFLIFHSHVRVKQRELSTSVIPGLPSGPEAQLQHNTEALDWALPVVIITIPHVTLWALHLPTIFREGFRSYIEDVARECLRMHQPGYVGLVCCMICRRDEWRAKYYTGRTKDLSNFENM